MSAAPRTGGFGLIELIVALTILAVGVLGLAGAAAVAHRALAAAESVERMHAAMAAVLDSLLQEPQPAPGTRALGSVVVRWHVLQDTVAVRIRVEARGADSTRSPVRAVEAVHHAH